MFNMRDRVVRKLWMAKMGKTSARLFAFLNLKFFNQVGLELRIFKPGFFGLTKILAKQITTYRCEDTGLSLGLKSPFRG